MKRGGGPERGNAAKTICLLDERPVGSPRQNGDDAESASICGRCSSSPFITWIAFSGLVDGDVHVHAEDQLAARDVLQLVDELAVAVARGDALPLEEAERVRSRRAEAAPLLARDVGDVAAERGEVAVDVTGVVADRSRHLEHRLHQLGVQAVGVLAFDDGREHGVDVLHEIPRLGVEQHVLLLDAERVRGAAAEVVLEDARGRGAAALRALARDRCGVDLLHECSITASASISTSQRGSSSCATMPVVAGRAVAKASPCARPTSSISEASVT